MHLKFWFKTVLYLYTPGGYGYVRHLRKFRDTSYVYSRDKHSVRNKHHAQSGWKEQSQGDFHYRDYKDYQEYVNHQGQKFNEILKMRGGFINEAIVAYRHRFYSRFRHLSALLPKSAHILCVGARQGTEVEVLRDIGFKNAYGIDLNPGPDNKFVRIGDFMRLENADSSLDMIYSNALDHAFNLESFFREHARVIKPDGYILYDVAGQNKEHGAFEAAGWKSQEVLFLLMLKYFKSVVKVETEPGWMWILLQGKTGM
ncbi:MAG: methyltransferase domain-containing protein [Phycisphaerae bacterium]|nr:methyltransferase domain-containing protein [Phycisphaerae bacterium]MDD5381700.1 methyltransferase domain-containing protein [Phycisphaerae bacterium]